MEHDVVIVGGGLAGCTAAMLYGRAGLRVALVEKHHRPQTFKPLCGHFILAGTEPMLRRTGIWPELVAAGGHAAGLARWSPAGWHPPPADVPSPISLRRERLDPLLRRLAGATPGVDLILGQQVTELVTRDGRVIGVHTRDRAGAAHEYRARLVVGADGNPSTVARLAGAAGNRSPNNRFGMWAYYRGLSSPIPYDNCLWTVDRDVWITIRTDSDLTMLVAFPTKDRLVDFRADPVGALERGCRELPDGPELAGAERVSKVIGTADYPCVRRDPSPAAGLVLVGDAAITGDPQPAVGCGWALRAAEWLVETTASALQGRASMHAATRAYRRRLRFILAHDRIGREAALAGQPNPLQRAIMRGAQVDPEIARRAYLFNMRAIPVSGLLNPGTVVRAILATGRHPATATSRASA